MNGKTTFNTFLTILIGSNYFSFLTSSWFCSHFSVTLALPKLLRLGNAKKKRVFLFYFTRLSVTLASPKLLRLGNEKKSELFFSISLDFP